MRNASYLLIIGLASGCTKSEPAAEVSSKVASAPREATVTKPAVRLIQGKPVTLADGTTLLLTQFVVEEIAESPEDPEAYPGGSGVVATVRVNGTDLELSELPDGYDSRRVAWANDVRVHVVDANTLGELSVTVDRRTDQVIAGSERRVRVERGKSVRLDGPLFLKFNSHGHKMVQAGGPASPLMVNIEYRVRAQVDNDTFSEHLEAETTHTLHPPNDATWRWRDFEIELGEYSYDSFMELEIRRLLTKPVVL